MPSYAHQVPLQGLCCSGRKRSMMSRAYATIVGCKHSMVSAESVLQQDCARTRTQGFQTCSFGAQDVTSPREISVHIEFHRTARTGTHRACEHAGVLRGDGDCHRDDCHRDCVRLRAIGAERRDCVRLRAIGVSGVTGSSSSSTVWVWLDWSSITRYSLLSLLCFLLASRLQVCPPGHFCTGDACRRAPSWHRMTHELCTFAGGPRVGTE